MKIPKHVLADGTLVRAAKLAIDSSGNVVRVETSGGAGYRLPSGCRWCDERDHEHPDVKAGLAIIAQQLDPGLRPQRTAQWSQPAAPTIVTRARRIVRKRSL